MALLLRARDRTRPLDPRSTRIDNEYYDRVGDAWWDRSGPFCGLHDMNPTRVGYFDHVFARQLGGRRRGSLRILDVGCGGGLVSEALAELGYTVAGVDVAPGTIDAARRHADRRGLAVDYRVGSAYELDEPDASVDGVVVSDVFEHLHDLDRAVAEIGRVLRPAAALAFDTINRTLKSYVVMILLAQRVLKVVHPNTHDWRMFVSPDELRRLLGEHGLHVEEVTGLVPAQRLTRVVATFVREHRLGAYTLGSDCATSYIGYAVKRPEGVT